MIGYCETLSIEAALLSKYESAEMAPLRRTISRYNKSTTERATPSWYENDGKVDIFKNGAFKKPKSTEVARLPSSSEPIMLYRSNPLRLRSLPRPKSSLVHWSTPALLITRQAMTTVSPTTAVWSSGSRSNRCTDRCDALWPSATPTQHSKAAMTSDHLLMPMNKSRLTLLFGKTLLFVLRTKVLM